MVRLSGANENYDFTLSDKQKEAFIALNNAAQSVLKNRPKQYDKTADVLAEKAGSVVNIY